ncbi:DUF4369 domain-containing protein [Lacinutrix iliipiscaria]|uniref:DUF4369 domain-containing protein n=1 Tax=Lacinutrix iliipiscaria TaxID=1230532 RepID=A0ABW5WLU0_9FLAO
MKKIVALLLLTFIFSCGKEASDLTVKVSVKGLKKGTIYLKKAQDSIIVTVDSVDINGEDPIELHSDLDSPEIFFIQLDKNSKEDEGITFFADKGITEINTSLKNFVIDAKIKGSKQQQTLENYLLLMSRINDKHLDLIKEEFEAKKDNDSIKIAENEASFNSLLKTKYLQTVNFAMQNNDSEVAPYIALTEIPNAQTKWLDTINNILTPKIKASKYGKELELLIAERKK